MNEKFSNRSSHFHLRTLPSSGGNGRWLIGDFVESPDADETATGSSFDLFECDEACRTKNAAFARGIAFRERQRPLAASIMYSNRNDLKEKKIGVNTLIKCLRRHDTTSMWKEEKKTTQHINVKKSSHWCIISANRNSFFVNGESPLVTKKTRIFLFVWSKQLLIFDILSIEMNKSGHYLSERLVFSIVERKKFSPLKNTFLSSRQNKSPFQWERKWEEKLVK